MRRRAATRTPVVITLVATLLSGASLASRTFMGVARASSCPSGSIEIARSDSTRAVQRKLAQPGTGRVFCWAPGVHHVFDTLKLHTGDRFVGASGGRRAVIDGSRRIRRFRHAGSHRWVARLRHLSVPRLSTPPGLECLDRTNHCAYPDDVYWGTRRLHRVWSASSVRKGRYYVDYVRDRIYVGSDPRARAIARAVPLPVVNGRAQSLIALGAGGGVSNLTVRHVGNGMQSAAISGNRVTISHVVVESAHGRGIGVDDRSTVTGSALLGNGQAGIGIGPHARHSGGSHGTISGNRVVRNGWDRCLGVCGGIKASGVNGLAIAHNLVKGTFGTPIWMDNGSIGYSITNNVVRGGRAAGIEAEISYDGLIAGNTVVGIRGTSEPVGAIHIQSSGACSSSCPPLAVHGIRVRGNVVGTRSRPNQYGIVLRQLSRGSGPYGGYVVRRVHVVGNSVSLSRGWTGAVDPTGSLAIYGHRNAFRRNRYHIAARRKDIFRWKQGAEANAWLTFRQWKRSGNDRAGSLG
jgi:hypothetical protein